MILETSFSSKKSLLALGGESEGVFSFYKNGGIFISKNFGDLIEEKNFKSFKKEISKILKKEKPDFVLIDLHPLYNPSLLGIELSKRYKIPLIKIQHHLAHIFSAFGEKMIVNQSTKLVMCSAEHINMCSDSKFPACAKASADRQIPNSFFGLACDGTGYGLDGKIWGGEIFKIQNLKFKIQIERIGHLENQTLIGGDLAIKEPVRMLISILVKFLKKDKIYQFVKKYYTRNQFELLYNQLLENFNCQETSSTGRILDTVSILLGFCRNERKYKHEPISLLEKKSQFPEYEIKPKIIKEKNKYLLLTTPLFEYLIENLDKDKRRLATTAQIYLAKGFGQILKKFKGKIFFAGGLANNKILSSYLQKRGAILNKILPRGDASLSFGQIIYYLTVLSNQIGNEKSYLPCLEINL